MPTGRVRWDLRETEKGKEGLEKDPEGTMPKVTRKNAVRRATKRHGFTSSAPPWKPIDTLYNSSLSATNIRERMYCTNLTLHHAVAYVSFEARHDFATTL